MRAVVVLAVGGVTHEFRKVTEHFARFDVHEPESLDAGGVDDVSAACQRVHAGERGRVHPLVVVLRNPVDADICIGYERLDEGGFARPRVACQQGGLSGREFAQRLQTGAFGRRHGIDRIAGGLIYRDELVQFVGPFRREVELVENDGRRDGVGLARHEETVDEFGVGDGREERRHEQGPVEVRGDDV